MFNDTTVTVRGWAGNDPMVYRTTDEQTGADNQISATIVSVGVTARVYNRKTKAYEDGPTTWYSVRCYGPLAQHVAASVRKGAPLLVRGSLRVNEYTDNQGQQRTRLVLIADSVAIDLNVMVASYRKPDEEHSAPAGNRVGSEQNLLSSQKSVSEFGAPASNNAVGVLQHLVCETPVAIAA